MAPLGDTIVSWLPLRYQRIAKQFIKFGITGSFGAIIDFGSFIAITRGIGWDPTYHVFGYELIGANMVSVFLAILSMFFVNKYWTFRNTASNVMQQGIGYFALNGTTFVLNQILTSFFAFYVPLVALIFGSNKDLAAKALAIGLILFLNFAGSKFLVFRRKPQFESA